MMASEDPFASVRLRKSDVESPTISEKSNVQSDADPFAEVRMQKDSEESVLSSILRGGSRSASRAAETLLGIPGDLSDIIQSGVLSGLESLTGIPSADDVREELKKYRAPTSQELESLSKKVTKGYTEPKTEVEKNIDEFTKTVSSLLGPIKFRKALGLATAGTGVSKGLEALGFDEPIQDAGKFGSIFTLSMVNPQGVQNLYKGLYDKVKKNTPNISLNVLPLESRLNSIEKNLKSGVSTPTKQAVLKPIQELKDKIVNGHISSADLIKSRFDLNELMGDPELLKRGKNAFPLVVRAVNKAIKGSYQLGNQIKKDLTSADEAFSAFQQSKKASNFIRNNLPGKPLNHAILAAGIEALAYPEALLPTAGGLLGGLGSVKLYELFSRVNANPTMRKYYLEMMKSAVNENKVSMVKFLHKIDQQLSEEDRSTSAKSEVRSTYPRH